MIYYKTAGEQFSLIMPLLFFLTNIFFKVIGQNYFEFSIWWIFLLLLYPIVHVLQFKINTKPINYIYEFTLLTTVYQILFVIFRLVELVIENIALIQINMNYLSLFTFLVLILGYMQSIKIPFRKLTLKTKKLTEEKKIIQISDSHVYGKRSTQLLEKIVNKIVKQSPDIVVITGDLFDYYGLPAKDSLKSFEKITCPIYYVYGNHENRLLKKFTKKIIEKSSIIPLVNESINFNEFQMVGLNNGSKDYLLKQTNKQKINKDNYSIFLQHKPINVEEVSKLGVDLMLSGHTHGGQFFPLNVLFHLRWEYLVGLYTLGKMKLYVSRGTGTKSFPFKLFVGNEITVITLMPENE